MQYQIAPGIPRRFFLAVVGVCPPPSIMPAMRNSSRIRHTAQNLPPPRADQATHVYTLHGEEHRDEFAYLRNPDDPRTQQYIRQENEYFHACFDPLSGFRDRLYTELKGRIIEDDVSVPETIHGYCYYTRIESGCQYPIHCRRPEEGGDEEIYLDENRLAGGARYCDVSVVSICPRQKRVAFSVDRTGDERYEVYIAAIPGGEPVCCASGTGDSIAWSQDGLHLLYTGIDANARPDSVWAYDLAAQTHSRLYAEADPAFHVTVWLSRSLEWIFVDSASNTSSETRVISASGPPREPVVLIPRREDVEYTADHHEDRFLILTNDTADNFRLAAVPASACTGEPDVELIPADDHVTLEFVDAYRRHWVVGELRDGVKHVSVRDPETGSGPYLPGSGPLSQLDVDDLYDYDASVVRYEYTTPVTPHTTYDFDVATGEKIWRKTAAPPQYDEDAYVCERLEVPSSGVRIPLTVVYRRDMVWDHDAPPLLLTGYGAYEESMDVEFDSDLLSLLDRGVVMAAAHVRGGGDLGPAWHDAGRLSKKHNSFADFLACAHYLIERGYTRAGRIAAWGASAGGLLAAVAAQREPGLFAAVVLEVPFLDVVNTLLDTGLPLTEYDFDEFGNPAVAEEYRWIRAYSPYDNIRPQAYPPMLVTTAMKDQRVGYWEALKWTARLRSVKSDDNPLLLKVDETGHLGESGRYEAVRESAFMYTFLLDMWGLTPDQ